MQKEVREAYDRLIPKDQMGVDIIIGLLRDKDQQIKDLTDKLGKLLDDLHIKTGGGG